MQTMVAAPSPAARVETARLVLRGHAPDDLEARLAMTGDLGVMAHLGGTASDREENWARIQRYNGHWALLGHGLFAVEDKANGVFVGEAGLARFERGLGEDFDPFPEAAWIFATSAQGKGYATEAMQAAIGWHEARFGPSRMVCVIAHENEPSLRVAEKLDFAVFAERPYKGADRLLLARPG